MNTPIKFIILSKIEIGFEPKNYKYFISNIEI